MGKCLYCGAEFDNVNAGKKFCSTSCRKKLWKTIPQICEDCGRQFHANQKNHYCYACMKRRYRDANEEPLPIIDAERAKKKRCNEHCSLDAYLDYADKTPHPIPYGTWIAKKTGRI